MEREESDSYTTRTHASEEPLHCGGACELLRPHSTSFFDIAGIIVI
jgi:hypothetical protein